jgi:hypothetical protein
MIKEAFERAFAARESRGDELSLHVSDLAKCRRATHDRRSGNEQIPPDADTRRKWDMGLDFEDRVGEVLAQIPGYVIEHNPIVSLDVDGESIVGHVDFVCRAIDQKDEDFVIEVKTTTFFPKQVGKKRLRVPPTASEVMIEHRIQAAAYCMALGIEKFSIIVCCRESGMMAEHQYRTRDYRDLVHQNARESVAQTDPNAPLPPAVPPLSTFNKQGESWACRYCSNSRCEKNENPAALAVPV